MKEIQCEIEDATSHWLSIDQHVLFIQMPTTRAGNQHSGVLVQAVVLAVLLQADRAQIGIAQIDLAIDHVFPGRAVGILKVSHEGGCTAVESIDDHLAIGRSGDLNPSVLQIRRLRADRPVSFTQGLGLGQKIRQQAAIELTLTHRSRRQQALPARLEGAMQIGHQRERLMAEDAAKFSTDRCSDLHTLRQRTLRKRTLRKRSLHGRTSRECWVTSATF